VAAGELHEPVDRASQVRDELIDSGLEIEHQPRVQKIMAASPVVDASRCGCVILLNQLDEGSDQLFGNIAIFSCIVCKRRSIEMFSARCLRNEIQCRRRNDSYGRLRARESDLEIQHALNTRTIAEKVAHRRAANKPARERRGEQGHACGKISGSCGARQPLPKAALWRSSGKALYRSSPTAGDDAMAMTMNGQVQLPAKRETVWAKLNDADVLKSCIPGSEQFERVSENEFQAVATVKVGPVKARWKGKVRLSDLDPPNSYRISGEGEGGVAGFAKGGAKVSLADKDGGTLLSYNVEAQVGGKLAQLGQRLINSAAKKTADDFFVKFAAAVVTI